MSSDSTPIDAQTLRAFLAERHSTRRFQDRDLASETLESLIETAAYIPSGGHRYAHEFTVLTRGESRARLMKELTRIYKKRSRLLNGRVLRCLARPLVDPVTREFLRDKEYGPRIRALVGKLGVGEDPIFHGAPAAIIIHSSVLIPTPKEDCVMAGFAVSLAAHAMGLGACFVTLGQNAINSSDRCKTILGFPRGEHVHAVVVVGYPEAGSRQPSHRQAKEIRYA